MAHIVQLCSQRSRGYDKSRLPGNERPKKLYIGSKGLTASKFAKMPILGQPEKMGHLCLNNRAGAGHFRIEGL